MANVGDRFKTGETCTDTGHYVFDGYVDGSKGPLPTEDERVVPLSRGETFPPVRSSNKACWRKLMRKG